MTVAVVLGWAAVGAVLGHLLDRVVRRAAHTESRRAAQAPAGAAVVPVAAGPGVSSAADASAGPDAPAGPAGPDAPAGPGAVVGPGAPGGPGAVVGPGAQAGPGVSGASAGLESGGVALDRHLHRPSGAVLVPVLAAAGAAVTGGRFGLAPAGLPFVLFVPLLAELAVVDLHTRRLPNVLTLPALPAGLLLVAVSAGAQGRPAVLAGAVAAAVLLFVMLLLMAVLRPAGMGMGDVKAAAVIGLYVGSLGVGPALAALVLAAVAAFAGGLVLVATGRIGPRTATPFGPWLAAGALAAVLAGPGLVSAYLALVG